MTPDGLTFEVTDAPDQITVRLSGEFDLNSRALFEHDILPLFWGGHPSAVIDLSGLTFIDSTGLFCLVKAWQQLEDRGVSAHLIRGTGVVDQVLKLSGLDAKFG